MRARPFRALLCLSLASSLAFAARCRAESAILVQNGLLFTMKAGEEKPFIGYLLIADDGKIEAIGKGRAPAGATARTVVDATGKFITPGFISAHSHIWQTANRGVGADETLMAWWAACSRYIEATTPEDLYWYTLHGSMDFVKSGITTAYNFTFDGSRWTGYNGAAVAPLPGPWEADQFRGEIDSGMRFVHSFCIPYFETPEKNHAKVVDFINFTKAYASNLGFLKLSIQGTVAFSTDASWAKVEASYMREFGLDNEMHMFEPPDQTDQPEKFRWLEEAGMLGPQLYFGHFIHVTPEIIAKVAKAGSNMVWQPLSNGRLGSGVADIPQIVKAGMQVGMGVDDQAASDVPDPFENMRTGLYAIRDKYQSAAALRPYDVLKFHTIGSATVMHVADKVGSLEVGKFGDFLVINPADRDIGPVYDPVASLVLACTQLNLEQVYIGGVLVSQRGRIVGRDFDRASKEVHARSEAIRDRLDGPPKY
ncbi:MAG TPA: amidohydrolase family protein [Opitutaceae bacterium]|jgi:cytosine/adenosine deaminase-related metal-dependent hydrolase|nr:amidohydrolase family protein [Opitutaceae bacterium]